MSARAAAAKVRAHGRQGLRAGRWGTGETGGGPRPALPAGGSRGRRWRGGEGGDEGGLGARLPPGQVHGCGCLAPARVGRRRATGLAPGKSPRVRILRSPRACPRRQGVSPAAGGWVAGACLRRSGWYPAKPCSFDLMSPAAVCAMAAIKL